MKERDTVDEKRGRPGLVATRSARRPFGHQQPVNGAMRVLGAVQHHFAVSLSGQLHPATADSPAGRHRLTGPAPRPAAKCRQTPSSAVVKKPRRREGGGRSSRIPSTPRVKRPLLRGFSLSRVFPACTALPLGRLLPVAAPGRGRSPGRRAAAGPGGE